jgi:S-adenosylmethionine hydrolase
MIGSSGYLEISLRNGSAARQTDAVVGDEVSVLAVS